MTMPRGQGAQARRRTRRAVEQSDQQGVRKALVSAPSDEASEPITLLPLSDRGDRWDAAAARESLNGVQYAFGRAEHEMFFTENRDGTLTAVWRGVVAAACGLLLADPDDPGVAEARALIEAYYKKAGDQFFDPAIKPPWEPSDDGPAPVLLAYAEVGWGDEDLFAERCGYWDAVLSPVDVAEEMRQIAAGAGIELADDMRECANCGHEDMQHQSGGACEMTGCGCEQFEAEGEASADAEPFAATVSDGVVVEFTPSGYAIEQAVAALVQDAPVAEPLVRFHLDQLRVSRFALPAPGETLPERTPGPEVPLPAGMYGWDAVFCPEGVLTDDGRAFAPGSISWRELPLSLMAQLETQEGHDGARVSGRIDTIWRDEAAGLIRAAGVFDEGEFGTEIARLVDEKVLRGLSVDIAPRAYEIAPRSKWFDDAGNWSPQPEETDVEQTEQDLLEQIFGGDEEEMIVVVTDGVIGAATVCSFPAFAEASIEIAHSLLAGANPALWTVTSDAGWRVTVKPKPLEGLEVPLGAVGVLNADGSAHVEEITAAAAGLAPVQPPADWFLDPVLPELTPLTVTEDGRVYGHIAPWDTCHIGIPGVCTTAPHSLTGYEGFHLGEIVCDDGSAIPCGQITLGTGHAGQTLDARATVAHYDNTGTVAAHGCCGEDDHGIWFAGALDPSLDAAGARSLRGAKPSGDWRYDEEVDNLELVAVLAVNVPGFPIPRTRALVSSGENGNPPRVLSLIGAGHGHARVTVTDREKLAALDDAAAGRYDEITAGL